MKLYAAPLQGFTEAPWRNFHEEVFGGIDAYYTPFVRIERGGFRNRDVRDIAPENNTVSHVVPQLIASTPVELERLAALLKDIRKRILIWGVLFRWLQESTRAPAYCLILPR